jgi:IS30 family transposase
MARENGVHKSTVGRELKRNRRCRSKQAHVTSLQRCRQARDFAHLSPALIALAVILIKQDFSPNQVAYLTDII